MRLLALLATACTGGDTLCTEGHHEVDGECVPDEADTDTDTDADTDTGPVGNDVSLDDYPPVVVSTSPEAGDAAVDPSVDTIEVRFSKPMTNYSWSWVQVNASRFPEIGDVAYVDAWTNVATGVVLEPGHLYQIWLNDPWGTYSSFIDEAGTPALAYPLIFATDAEGLDGLTGGVVRTVPEAGSAEADPSLTRIEVTFAKPMLQTDFGWYADADETAIDIEAEGFLDERTAYADVSLDPGTTYAVWLNTEEDTGFRDAGGWGTAPYLLTFRTAEP